LEVTLGDGILIEVERDDAHPGTARAGEFLGIVADKELMAPGNRPIEIVDGGKVRKELLV